MPAFEYHALNAQGKTERGILEGDSARQVRQVLRARGVTLLEVNEVAQKQHVSTNRLFLTRGRLKPADLALMTRQLATLVRAGSPLDEALQAIIQQTERASARRMFSAIRAKVKEGHGLAAALKLYPNAFSMLYRATVGAGEQSGHLPAVLERLADYTETHQHNQQKITAALIYPLVLMTVAFGVVFALMRFVVPMVLKSFETLDIPLHPLTRMMVASSNFLQHHGITLLVGLLAVLVLFAWLVKRPAWQYRFHSIVLMIPVVGRLIRGANAENFARTLSILASSGVPVLDALKISADVVTNQPMHQAVLNAADRVREGMPIHKALEKSGYFPPMMVYLIASGEGSGQLDTMLARAASQQERETQMQISVLMGLLEPAMILFMGLVVTSIVLSIMLPVMDGMSKLTTPTQKIRTLSEP